MEIGLRTVTRNNTINDMVNQGYIYYLMIRVMLWFTQWFTRLFIVCLNLLKRRSSRKSENRIKEGHHFDGRKNGASRVVELILFTILRLILWRSWFQSAHLAANRVTIKEIRVNASFDQPFSRRAMFSILMIEMLQNFAAKFPNTCWPVSIQSDLIWFDLIWSD